MSSAISIAIVVIVGLAVFGGLRRGLRRELVNLAGILLAFVGGILLAKPVAALFKHYGVIEEVPYLLAFVCGFIAVSFGLPFCLDRNIFHNFIFRTYFLRCFLLFFLACGSLDAIACFQFIRNLLLKFNTFSISVIFKQNLTQSQTLRKLIAGRTEYKIIH